jgi:hypothetical protein
VYRSAVEVLCNAQDECFILRDALLLVAPFPGNLDCCLDGFGTCVHGQDHVEAEVFGHEFGESGENIVIECSRAQRQGGRLLCQCFDQFWVAMPLVHG